MINHVKGDIFKGDADIIIHQVNCQGVMGSGVAKQVKDLYPNVYVHYREYCKDFTPEEMLGTVFMVPIDNKPRFVANFFSQNDFGYDGNCYTNYEAFEKCLLYMKKNILIYQQLVIKLIKKKTIGKNNPTTQQTQATHTKDKNNKKKRIFFPRIRICANNIK